MKISIVLGAGFGDEGKGKVTNFLSKQSDKSLVIRFNGGQQAGHTVVENGVRHVFSSFGSGTLNGTPTFISKYCTIFPPAMMMEYQDLKKVGVDPIVYADPLAMVTTPYDVAINRSEEITNAHGSCGSGFGKTVERHETLDSSYRIFAKDLGFPWILKQKLEMLAQKVGGIHGIYANINRDLFLDECKRCSNLIRLVPSYDILSTMKFENFVFEGAQGILLDREHGIFPHVTRSHTTSKNVLEMLSPFNLTNGVDIHYLTRCYQTRHGNGPLAGEEFSVTLMNNENETNVTNPWQGEFRIAPMSINLLKYAIASDFSYHGKINTNSQIMISHLDQLEQIPLYVLDGLNPYIVDRNRLIKLVNTATKIPVTTSNSESL